METQDLYEFDRVRSRISQCRRMNAILGGHEYTFDELSQVRFTWLPFLLDHCVEYTYFYFILFIWLSCAVHSGKI